jgi:hypothetical protein
MNWETIVTGVLTGVIASAITGYLGVYYGFKQLKKQRAFDRQLEWYERTVRALGAVPHLNTAFAIARDDRKKAELEKAVLDLQRCASEAPLYAEQSSWEQLEKMHVDLKGDPLEQAKAFEEVMRKTAAELSAPVRKMLDLKEIVFKGRNE